MQRMLLKIAFGALVTTVAFSSFAVEPVRVFVVGDSLVDSNAFRVAGRGSWAEALRPQLKAGYVMVNLGFGGTSTRTYRATKKWEEFLSQARRGDWLLVTLGRNDASGSTDRNTTVEQYKANLAGFAEEAVAKGVRPLLVTPAAECNFAPDGRYVGHRQCRLHAAGMRALAAERGYALVDLETPMADLLHSLGTEKARTLYMVSVDGRDVTHLTLKGADCAARFFCQAALEAGIPFVSD